MRSALYYKKLIQIGPAVLGLRCGRTHVRTHVRTDSGYQIHPTYNKNAPLVGRFAASSLHLTSRAIGTGLSGARMIAHSTVESVLYSTI